MAYYLHDTHRKRHLIRGLGPMWRWAPAYWSPLEVAEAQARALRPAGISGLTRPRLPVIGLARHGLPAARPRRTTPRSAHCGALAGERIKNLAEPRPEEQEKVDGKVLHVDCARAVVAMQRAAYQDGIRAPLLTVQSGYRPAAVQARLFSRAVAKYGSVKAARKWVAPPESSTHQTGCAVDLNLGVAMGTSPAQIAKLSATPAYRWLQANASKFGFAPYSAEPWHWECDEACKAQARARWGSILQRGRAGAAHAGAVVAHNPGKAGAGLALLLAVAAFFAWSRRR